MFNIPLVYGLEEVFEIFESIFDAFSLLSVFTGGLSVFLYIIQGFALLSMANKCDIKQGWLGFIPVANFYLFGKIAEQYKREDNKKSLKYSLLLPVFYVLQMIATVILIIVFVISVISIISVVELAIENDQSLNIQMFSSFVGVIVGYVITMAIAIIFSVFNYIAMWRIFSMFKKENAVLFLVLSIFFSFLGPIFMFIIRNNNRSDTDFVYFETEQ